MREIPPSLQHRVFTTAEAREAGITARMLSGHRFRQVFRGVHALTAHELTARDRLEAALLAGPPDAVISHRSAQRLYGPDLRGDDGVIHVSSRGTAACRDPRIRVHRRLHAIGRRDLDGLPVTSPARTFVDCALVLTFVQLVVFGDWLVHRGLARVEELAGYCADRHLDGVALAREAVGQLVADSRSPMETLVRLMVVFAGLPRPAANLVVVDDLGRKVGTFDLVFARFRVIVEYDGRWHERSADQRRADRDRREQAERLGWTVLTLFDTDLTRPALVVARVHEALARGGYLGPRPFLGADWHQRFAARI